MVVVVYSTNVRVANNVTHLSVDRSSISPEYTIRKVDDETVNKKKEKIGDIKKVWISLFSPVVVARVANELLDAGHHVVDELKNEKKRRTFVF